MKRFALVLGTLLALAPSAVSAYNVDLGFQDTTSIFFDGKLVSGSKIRLYAKVTNFGSQDAEGFVQFYQGTVLVGQSQTISVRSNGLADEVFVDFTVPQGSFNIRAQLLGVNPTDENPANNGITTPVYTPIVDQDGDGVTDDKDNCKNAVNADQRDQDGDGIGDACDDDIDGDGIVNSKDNCSMSSNANQSDVDGDGVGDMCDSFDNRPPKVNTPSSTSASTPTSAPTSVPTTPSPTTGTGSTVTPTASGSTKKPVTSTNKPAAVAETAEIISEETEPVTDEKPTLGNFSLSPRATFSYERKGWNRYVFHAQTYEGQEVSYSWDFGDGSSSAAATVEHTFKGAGEYRVRLAVAGANGQVADDSATISISFFNFSNWQFAALLGSLGVFLLILMVIMGKLKDDEDEQV